MGRLTMTPIDGVSANMANARLTISCNCGNAARFCAVTSFPWMAERLCPARATAMALTMTSRSKLPASCATARSMNCHYRTIEQRLHPAIGRKHHPRNFHRPRLAGHLTGSLWKTQRWLDLYTGKNILPIVRMRR
jgi:hypothetical protein